MKIYTRISGKKKLFAISALALTFIYCAYTNPNGYVGGSTPSSSGCDCHGSSSSAVSISAASSSGSFTFAPGSTNSLTLTIKASGYPKAGVDISVIDANGNKSGTLVAGSGLKLSSKELTHSSPSAMQNGSITYSFSWTAPTTEGKYYLNAAGMAANGNGGKSGDIWGFLQPIEITVSSNTSVNEALETQAQVFPNPNSIGLLKVTLPLEYSNRVISATITNMSGSIIKKFSDKSENGILDLPIDELSSGVYNICILIGEQRVFKQFIVY